MNRSSPISMTNDARVTPFAHTRHMNRAFIIESLVLLVFISVSIALLVQMFAAAGINGAQAHRLTMSSRLSSDAAEAFCANPHVNAWTAHYDADGNQLDLVYRNADGNTVGGVFDDADVAWTVVTDGTADMQAGGMLYHAHITVTAKDGTAYDLDTERYVSASAGSDA